MAIDHIGFAVEDLAASRAFYEAALRPLGVGISKQGEGWALFGRDGEGALWIGSAAVAGPVPGHVHVAFTARDRAAVDAFHAAALGAGGRDNGAPGLRPQYHEHYYAAFAIDPNGHNVEAVCHAAEDNT